MVPQPGPEEVEIGIRLSEFRRQLGLTQEGAAERFGVGLRTWNRYENGARRPSGTLLLKLADAGLNVNWLTTGAGSMLAVESNDERGVYFSKEGALTREEEAILGLYRGLTKPDRARAKAVINALASVQLKKDKTG